MTIKDYKMKYLVYLLFLNSISVNAQEIRYKRGTYMDAVFQ